MTGVIVSWSVPVMQHERSDAYEDKSLTILFVYDIQALVFASMIAFASMLAFASILATFLATAERFLG